MKLAVVGGGSTYTPELVDGFARLRDTLPLTELALIDPAADRVELIGGLARRIFAKQGHPGIVSTHTELEPGVEGADAVLIQLRVGGQTIRNVDETFPLEFCCVGQETTGAGGFAKALRTVPVVLDIAERVRRIAPQAWIIDFTNPVGIVTRALLDAGHRAVGLCNVAIGFQRRAAAHLGVEPSRIKLDHVGLNHLTWERGFYLDGEDFLPKYLGESLEEISHDIELPAELIRRLNAIPSYYLRYFYAHDIVVKEQIDQVAKGENRAKAVAAVEAELLAQYADPALDTKPEALSKRGGAFYSEAAVELLASLHGDLGEELVVNVRNAGTFPFLADDAVIEVPAIVDASGVRPAPLRAPIEPLYRGLIGHVSAYEELAVAAAINGGVDRVRTALLAHPLVGQADLADKLADSLVAKNRDFLPWA
ncbi:6-phospho-beta-glucosidase [Catenulispora sp. NL8]|uniref:6-phospho-beta-glucosidase n=1 Tax=Catenulispora pinistramenti TaxID=2705254 RepID=A0ABS5KUQ3_9ACTN|nr:6-phospho-beta-glucosidase [Catenulispora pinistramenti]MBS2549788.1 6-phospho-beta-glucosidase [Catenulispora pinistramenti]